ncbi:MAG: toll/interleukin-1 receptor domain-containing protein [Ferruginibacter sp.]
MTNPISIFISYSHDDEKYLKKIRSYLRGTDFENIQIWDDNAMKPGELWDDEIKNRLENADIILLLVSMTFLYSTYINKVELTYAFDRHKKNQCIIIPIFIRTCPLEDEPANKIASIQGFPRSNQKRKKFYSEMDEEIYEHLDDMRAGVKDAIERVKRNRLLSSLRTDDNKKELGDQIDKLRNNNHIYLSLPASDTGLTMYTRFFQNAKKKKEIGLWDFDIITDNNSAQQKTSGSLLTEQTRKMINESVYTIHIITSVDELHSGIVKEQIAIAEQKNKSDFFSRSIMWVSSDEITKGFGENLKENQVATSIETIFDIIEDFELQRNKKIKEIENTYAKPVLKTLMIFDYSKDNNDAFRQKVKTELEKKKVCSVRLNPPGDVRNVLKDRLDNCQGAIIVYGMAESGWYLYCQDMLYESQLIKSKAVCVSNPDIDKKINGYISVNEFMVLREDADDIDDELNNFLNKLTA